VIDNWRYVTTGFLQTQGTPTRLVSLWQELHAKYSAADSVVRLCSWNNSWSDEAEFVFRLSPGGRPSVVQVFAYSWGAGWGAMEFARQLRIRGINVSLMVLVDPVYRHTYRTGNWRSYVPNIIGQWRVLSSWSKIVIPDNVRGDVHWFRQQISWPAGHDLVAEDARWTRIYDPITLKVNHTHMDDQKVVVDKCMGVAHA
tara:strand:+ start:4358 stop:4954 length:597 start_codon:yes stop_codon:yes gene_type:complete